MKNKPLLFTIICILCLIEPAIKILYLKASTEFDFGTIFTNLSARTSVKEIFDFWIMYPLAGLFLLKIRRWTYIAFMAVLVYIVVSMLTYEKYTWPYNSDAPYAYHYVLVGLACACFIAFLSPTVREPFFDRRIRWWENKTRYVVGINCSLKNEAIVFNSEIVDISASGAFLKDSSYFNIGDHLDLEFSFLGQDISLPVIVVHKHNVQGKHGWGVRFNFKSFKQNVMVSKLINTIKLNHQVAR